jgi:hypothetical protein
MEGGSLKFATLASNTILYRFPTRRNLFEVFDFCVYLQIHVYSLSFQDKAHLFWFDSF